MFRILLGSMQKIKEHCNQDQYSGNPSKFHKKGNQSQAGKKEIMIIRHSIGETRIFHLEREIPNLLE